MVGVLQISLKKQSDLGTALLLDEVQSSFTECTYHVQIATAEHVHCAECRDLLASMNKLYSDASATGLQL